MKSVNGRNNGRVASRKSGSQVIKGLVGSSIVALPLIFQTVQAQSAQAQPTERPVAYSDQNYQDDGFMRRVYGGIGFGASSLEPDTSQVPNVDTVNSANAGVQLMVGADFNKWFSLEGHIASLGEAELSQGGTIGYKTVGVSALAYAGKNRDHFNRRGLSGFGRLGYGYLMNSPSDGLDFEQVNPSHLLLGAGLEFATRKGLGVRGEVIAFDSDVRYGQLSLLYRFGNRSKRTRDLLVEAPKIEPAPVVAIVAAPTRAPAPVVAPVATIAVAPIDQDVDGVNDSQDNCPNTKRGVAVDEVGCDLFSGVIEGVNFNSGSADLTQNAQGILSGVVSTLNKFPSVKLTIMAHTDSQGDDSANKNLSKQRARSVAVYLVRNGVSATRLKAYGYGEERPVDTNETPQGRLRNRRVEFNAVR